MTEACMKANIYDHKFTVSKFHSIREDGVSLYAPKEETLLDMLQGRCLILTLPGAFTPTCSTLHVPAFEAAAPRLRELGINRLFILTGNDVFAQRVWADALGLRELEMIADWDMTFSHNYGNALFRHGLGVRPKREVLLFRNGQMEARFSENYVSSWDDPYENTKVENILNYLEAQDGDVGGS